eukprot:m.152167 g.152167  ORF g.152167 m.152167 type:complete len:417 (+) comp17434_c0_seq2:117-1367(+)
MSKRRRGRGKGAGAGGQAPAPASGGGEGAAVSAEAAPAPAPAAAAATTTADKQKAIDAAQQLKQRIAQLSAQASEQAQSDADAAAERAAAAKALAKTVKRASTAVDKHLATVESADEKIAYLKSLYLKEVSDRSKLENSLETKKAQLATVQRERDSSKSDLTRWQSEKLTLQNLSRQLTAELKITQEDRDKRLTAERRLSDALQQKLDEALERCQQQAELYSKLAEDHKSSLTRFEEFISKHEQQSKEQLAAGESTQAAMKSLSERCAAFEAISEAQQKQLTVYKQHSEDLQKQNATLIAKVQQHEEFQGSVDKSIREVRQDIEKTQKQRVKREKQNIQLQKRLDKQNAAAVLLAQQHAAELMARDKKVEKLESLCRALQQNLAQMRGQSSQAAEAEGKGEDEAGAAGAAAADASA